MSYGPQTFSCPKWAEDVPPNRAPEFADAVRIAIALVTQFAPRTMLSDDMLGQLHYVMFERFVPLDYYAGNYRQDDVNRPCLGTDVKVDAVPGVFFLHVINRMGRLIEDMQISIARTELRWQFLNQRDRARIVAATIAKVVGEFIRIHPFVNGNGRVSRLIWRWGLHRFGAAAQVRIFPRPEQPYAALMQASMINNDGPLAIEILRHLGNYPPAIH